MRDEQKQTPQDVCGEARSGSESVRNKLVTEWRVNTLLLA